MAETIAIENKEDRIRAILGVSDADIQDAIINYPEYYPSAVSWAIKRFPLWEDFDADKMLNFQSLILYKTAQSLITLCQASVWSIQKEKTTHAEVSYFKQGQSQMIASSIRDNIGELISELTDTAMPYFIGIDRSGRR